MTRPRILFLLAALLALATAFTACGGDDEGGGGGEDPQQVLDQTFSGDNDIQSADVDATFEISVEGEDGGNLTAGLSGPVDGSGDGVPKFDLTATVTGEGSGDSIDFEGGAVSTGDAGYVTYQGDAYELDAATYGFVKQVFASAEQQQTQEDTEVPDVRSFLTDVTNEGTEDVEGTDTVHVSGAVDIDKLVDELRPLAEQASELPQLGAAGQIPSPEELDQLTELVKSATFDVYSGTDDNILRRFDINLDLKEPGGPGAATINLDITLGGVNEPKEVEAPGDAKPLSQLLDTLGVDLGALGGLGGLGGAGGAGGAGSGGAGAGGADLDCLQQAQTPEELEQCLQ